MAYEVKGHKLNCICRDCTENRLRILSQPRKKVCSEDEEWSDDQQDFAYKAKRIREHFHN